MTEQGKIPGTEETRILLQKAHAGDYAAREKLTSSHFGLVRAIAHRYCFSGRSEEDLFQVGCIGLLNAIDRFDLSYDVCFSTYAVPLILGEIRRFILYDNPIRVSRQLRERAIQLDRCRQLMYQAEGSEPNLEEVAEACALSREQAVAALNAVRPVASINEPRILPSGEGEELGESICSKIGEIDDFAIDRMTLLKALEALPERLSYILRCRYFAGMTQSEVAREIGVTQVQVSRLEKKALVLIRNVLEGAS